MVRVAGYQGKAPARQRMPMKLAKYSPPCSACPIKAVDTGLALDVPAADWAVFWEFNKKARTHLWEKTYWLPGLMVLLAAI